jgi:hypothetical protein
MFILISNATRRFTPRTIPVHTVPTHPRARTLPALADICPAFRLPPPVDFLRAEVVDPSDRKTALAIRLARRCA